MRSDQRRRLGSWQRKPGPAGRMTRRRDAGDALEAENGIRRRTDRARDRIEGRHFPRTDWEAPLPSHRDPRGDTGRRERTPPYEDFFYDLVIRGGTRQGNR